LSSKYIGTAPPDLLEDQNLIGIVGCMEDLLRPPASLLLDAKTSLFGNIMFSFGNTGVNRVATGAYLPFWAPSGLKTLPKSDVRPCEQA